MSEVISAFQYYLSRYPENEQTISYLHSVSGGNFNILRERIAEAPEYERNLHRAHPAKTGCFFKPVANAPKIVVLGNCQGPNIAMALSSICAVPISTCGLEIMSIDTDRSEMMKIIEDAQYIVSCKTYNDIYKDLSAESLRNRLGVPIIEYSPIHFTGIHPDIIVVGKYGKRIIGPIGDYNSKIILSAFCRGMSTQECLESFNEETYRKAQYFEQFSLSARTMLEREAALGEYGLKIGEWFIEEVKNSPLLYSINHPTSSVFIRFASEILDLIDMPRRMVPSEIVQNTLHGQVIWPVDQEISGHHNISYDSGPLYWSNGVALDREEFIWRSYKSYSSIGKDLILDALRDEIITF